MNHAQIATHGFICPVRGCVKKHNRKFSLFGLCMHIRECHGEEELVKRLRGRGTYKYSCTARGCSSERKMGSFGLARHMITVHGLEEVQKRLRCQYS